MLNNYISRETDHIGNLSRTLRDLKGFKTLVFELIQNADDSSGVTSMVFDVSDDALIVDNDGAFSDCGHPEDRECRWKSDLNINYRCDFHRFTRISSGDKRNQSNTTGAFGIGFIAVYQITDKPELISSKRHWIIHEDNSADHRIEVCSGCKICLDRKIPNTRFILPWAKDPDSNFRKELQVEAISDIDTEKIVEEFSSAILLAILFLKNIVKIDLKRNGKRVSAFTRCVSDDILTITQNKSQYKWYLLHGDFIDIAVDIRQKYKNQIETKRETIVTIAIPTDHNCRGLLYTCLPSEQYTELPFHINADFYPSNDRKHVIFGDDFQSDWNVAAIKSAASTVATHLENLAISIGHIRLWELMRACYSFEKADIGDTWSYALSLFWGEIEKTINFGKVIFTTKREWEFPSKSYYLLKDDEVEAIPVLENFGLKIINEELRPFQSMFSLRKIETKILDLDVICDILLEKGFNRRKSLADVSNLIPNSSSLIILWNEIHRLRLSKGKYSESISKLKRIAIVPVNSIDLCTFTDSYRADSRTRELISILNPKIALADRHPDFAQLIDIVEYMDFEVAVNIISELSDDVFDTLYKSTELKLSDLFSWSLEHIKEIRDNKRIRSCIGSLCIYPCKDKLHKLHELFIPSDFNDPIGLINIIDLKGIEEYRELFIELGMPLIDFNKFIETIDKDHTKVISEPTVKQKLLDYLVEKQDVIRLNPNVCGIIKCWKIFKCLDGKYYTANECYIKNEEVERILGDSVNYIDMPTQHISAYTIFCEIVGIASKPRVQSIINYIKAIVNQKVSAHGITEIEKCVSYLGVPFQDSTTLTAELNVLKDIRWLPVEDNHEHWFRPSEVYAGFRAHLFKSQANFLDFSKKAQDSSSKFLQLLGVRIEPDTTQVVAHLKHLIEQKIEIPKSIYTFLNDNSDKPIISHLKSTQCIYLNKRFFYPKQVFWNDHHFGSYRWTLSDELKDFFKLFRALDVKESPTAEDAVAVMIEIAEKFGSINKTIDEENFRVISICWNMIDSELDQLQDIVKSKLSSIKCIPGKNGILQYPYNMYFENQVGLSQKFDIIKNHVIDRTLGAYHSMKLAGVRNLSEEVKIELLEATSPKAIPELTKLTQEKKEQLARSLLFSICEREIWEKLTFVDKIEFIQVELITVRYTLPAFNRVTEIYEDVQAYYQISDNSVYYVLSKSGVPWKAISREFAKVIISDEDSMKIALQINEVLSADTPEIAEKALDDYGFPPLSVFQNESTQNQDAETLDTLGVAVEDDLTNSDTSSVTNALQSDNPSVSSNNEIPSENEPPSQASSMVKEKQDSDDLNSVTNTKCPTNPIEGIHLTIKVENNPPVNNHNEVSGNTTDLANELLKRFKSSDRPIIDSFVEDSDEVSNPERRRTKEFQNHKTRIANEPDYESRRKMVERAILEGPDESIRSNLLEWYGGKCQICGCDCGFIQKNGYPFYISTYLFERKVASHADNIGNALCLCAEHFAKLFHARENDLDDIISQFHELSIENGNQEVQIILYGKQERIRYTKKHIIVLQEYLRALGV